MPELPEVETIKRVLELQLKSLEISDITVNRTDIIAYPSAEIFCEKIKDQTISAMDRRGKFLEANYVFPIHAVLGGSGTSRVMRRTHTAEFQD